MSIKTLRKRIALVAVSALGAGFMSVVAVPSANATTTAAGQLTILGNASTGAAADVVAGTDDVTNGNSQGLLTYSTTGKSIGGANQLTQTATVRLDGAVAITFKPAASTYATIGVVGGSITESQGASAAMYITTGGTGAYNTTASENISVVVKPSAVGTMVIAAYSGSAAGGTTTLTAKVTVTVVASGAAYGVVSPADSTVYWGTAASSTSDTSTTDVTSSNFNKANSEVLEGTIYLVDAYGNDVSSSSGLLTCSVTTGAVCNLDTTAGTIAAGSAASDFSTHTTTAIYFSVAQATANVPVSGTLTVKYNDTVLATKSFTIRGTVAKLIVSNVGIGRTGDTSADNFYYTAQDSAGNTVYMSSGISVYAATLNEAVTAASVTTYQTSSSVVTGKGSFTCSGTAGYGITVNGAQAKLKLRVADATGTYVYSNEFVAKCGGDAKAFTASLDKASYTPGSVATLTFKFTDDKGNPANDFYTLTAGDTTGLDANILTYVGAPGTVVTAAVKGDKPLAGVKTYQFIVGTTEGDFNMVADAPYVRAQNLALGGAQGKITVPYTIKSSSTAVTNAEVLAAIVKLIASINKQIRALQRSLR